jgi:hypothetical protein
MSFPVPMLEFHPQARKQAYFTKTYAQKELFQALQAARIKNSKINLPNGPRCIGLLQDRAPCELPGGLVVGVELEIASCREVLIYLDGCEDVHFQFTLYDGVDVSPEVLVGRLRGLANAAIESSGCGQSPIDASAILTLSLRGSDTHVTIDGFLDAGEYLLRVILRRAITVVYGSISTVVHLYDNSEALPDEVEKMIIEAINTEALKHGARPIKSSGATLGVVNDAGMSVPIDAFLEEACTRWQRSQTPRCRSTPAVRMLLP